MQMITTSSKLSKLFLFNGETIQYQVSVHISPAYFFLLSKILMETKTEIEMDVARLRSLSYSKNKLHQ